MSRMNICCSKEVCARNFGHVLNENLQFFHFLLDVSLKVTKDLGGKRIDGIFFEKSYGKSDVFDNNEVIHHTCYKLH